MPSILLIEDEMPIARLIQDILEHESGYSVTVARNGREGLTCIVEHPPDAILCDIMMPIMNGIELCSTLAQDTDYKNLPIILMSAGRPPQPGVCGYTKFLRKPFEVETLLRLFHALLGPHTRER